MNLTHDQLRSAFFGACRIVETAEGLQPLRFTEAEQALYATTPEDRAYYPKTFGTAGIRLEFRTDSQSLAFGVLVDAASAHFSHCQFDLLKDGKLLANIDISNIENRLRAEFDLGEGEKTVALYFPWAASAVLCYLTLDDGATFAPCQKTRRMLAYGDSITQGYHCFHPSRSYASRLADAFSADMINKGIGGEQFRPALAELADPDLSPDLITVAYGTNDWAGLCTDFEELKENSQAFLTTLSRLYPAAELFVITPIWREDLARRRPDMPPFAAVDEWLTSVAESLPGAHVIHGMDLVPHDPAFYHDRYLHPNDQGFDRYFENLVSGMQAVL